MRGKYERGKEENVGKKRGTVRLVARRNLNDITHAPLVTVGAGMSGERRSWRTLGGGTP